MPDQTEPCPTCKGNGIIVRVGTERGERTRERARIVKDLAARGFTFRQIAHALGISGPSMVKYYMDKRYAETENLIETDIEDKAKNVPPAFARGEDAGQQCSRGV